MYLMTFHPTGAGVTYKYVDITAAQATRITYLTRTGKLPPTFTLNNQPIVSDTILGFTDKAPTRPRTADEVRAWVYEQPWYRHRYGARTAESASESSRTNPDSQLSLV
jgi:hypothetical protein